MKKLSYLIITILIISCSSKDTVIEANLMFENGPYQHVSPEDVGVIIGVGVIAPIPTEVYTGNLTITSPTTIENKVINGCLRIDTDNVTIRNSVINCDGLYPIKVENGSKNFTIEYSKVNCRSSSKIFFFPNGAPNVMIAYNELIGCQDFFFIQGHLNGMVVKNNYMHTLVGTSQAHADGFQIGEFSQTTGNIHVQGNYFDPDNSVIGKTGLIFATNFSEVTLIIEDNYIEPWGHFTIRCASSTQCIIRNNIFSQAFDGSQGVKHILLDQTSETITFACNRYADGEFVKKNIDNNNVLSGIEHTISNCPEFNKP